jgi:dTMP kinase
MSGKGWFITLEGGEGAGKSTCARAIATHLELKAGHEVVLTREPGGSPQADEIRALLVQGEPGRWFSRTEALLMFAARAEHVEAVIAPALRRGAIVICDRYVDSSRAYQGIGRDLGVPAIDALAAWIKAPEPDLTLIFDVDPIMGLARSRGTEAHEDRFERMGLEWHRRVRQAFLDIAAAAPHRCRVIEADQSRDAVLSEANALIEETIRANA